MHVQVRPQGYMRCMELDALMKSKIHCLDEARCQGQGAMVTLLMHAQARLGCVHGARSFVLL